MKSVDPLFNQVIDGTFDNPDTGSIESKIEVTAISADTPFTCNVEVTDGNFRETEDIKVFGKLMPMRWVLN